MLLTSGNRRADLKVLNIRVAQMTDLRVDVSLRHDFIGAGRDGERTHGKLRNPDNPDQILETGAAPTARSMRSIPPSKSPVQSSATAILRGNRPSASQSRSSGYKFQRGPPQHVIQQSWDRRACLAENLKSQCPSLISKYPSLIVT